MTVALILIFASIADLPSIISIIGGLKAKKLRYVLLIAVAVALLGTLISASPRAFELMPYKLIAQLIVAAFVFWIARNIRKHNADDPKKASRQLVRFAVVLFIMFSALFALMGYLGAKRGQALLKAGAERAELMKKSEPSTPPATPILNRTNPIVNMPARPVSRIPKLGDIQADGSVHLYREPVEIYWNDWRGQRLPGNKVHISSEGKTVQFDGILELNCDSRTGHSWHAASNGYSYNGRSMTEAQIKETVPNRVMIAAYAVFCLPQ